MTNYPKDTTTGGFRRLAHEFAEYRRRQREYRKLHDMPDALLEDIGITRMQLQSAMKWHIF